MTTTATEADMVATATDMATTTEAGMAADMATATEDTDTATLGSFLCIPSERADTMSDTVTTNKVRRRSFLIFFR